MSLDDGPRAPAHRVIDPSVLYVGTPAYLVVTRSGGGQVNLAPASSHYALGRMLVLGLEHEGQSLANLHEFGELTVNFPSSDLWPHVERLAGVTGRNPVPAAKAGSYQYVADKFAHAGLHSEPSELVGPPRVRECPLQFEGIVRRITSALGAKGSDDGGFSMVEVEVVRVHAAPELIVDGTNHIDPRAWHPLIYSFRHFFERGAELGWTRKSGVAQTPEEISRWESFGGTWRVASASEESATIELCRCDGGEVAEVLEWQTPELVRWARVQEAAQ